MLSIDPKYKICCQSHNHYYFLPNPLFYSNGKGVLTTRVKNFIFQSVLVIPPLFHSDTIATHGTLPGLRTVPRKSAVRQCPKISYAALARTQITQISEKDLGFKMQAIRFQPMIEITRLFHFYECQFFAGGFSINI